MALTYSEDTIAFVVLHRNEQKEIGNARELLMTALNKYSKVCHSAKT